MTAEASIELEAGVAAPRAARRFVGEQLTRWGCSELADTASLCVSEIVTNAVFHAGRGIGLHMRWTPPILRVEVHDQSPDSAIPTAVVAAVAEEAGVELDRRKVHLDDPIRTVGTHEVPVKLHSDVQFRITLEVTKA